LVGSVSQIERVFGSAGKQKVWDHFTKAQRKNLTSWKKQLQDVQNLMKDSSIAEEDMDLEDDQEKDESFKKKRKINHDKLKEESEEWACQAQTYRNEVESVKAEMQSELESKEKQIQILQKTLQGMQLQLLEAQKKSGNLPGFLMDKDDKLKNVTSKFDEKKLLDIEPVKDNSSNDTVKESEVSDIANNDEVPADKEESQIKVSLDGQDARLVAVISTFLNVHPFGAGTEYIWSYLLRLDPGIQYRDVETLMEKYPSCFTMEVEGVGANICRKWKLTVFNSA